MARNEDYFPEGAANDRNAPYNEYIQKERSFSCVVTETLQKNVLVPTNKYREYYERNEDGGTDHWFEFEDVDWRDEYELHNDTLQEVLNKCHYTLKQVLEYLEKGYQFGSIDDDIKKRVKKLIDDCQGWETEEREVKYDE